MSAASHIISRIWVLLVLSCIAVSCEEDYLLVRDEFKPSIVVNSIFTINQPWLINVSLSKDVFDAIDTFETVKNANVFIVENSNGRIISLAHIGNGQYFSDKYTPLVDKSYTLHVEVEGYDVVTAISKSPKHAEVTDIVREVVEISGREAQKVSFQILDNDLNYYIWGLLSNDNKNSFDTTYKSSPVNLVKSLQSNTDIASIYKNNLEGVGDAEANEGGAFSTIDTEGIGADGVSETDSTSLIKYLRILTASKELYEYYKSVERFRTSGNHNTSFSTSPRIYSNVENGLGLFAGYAERFIELE